MRLSFFKARRFTNRQCCLQTSRKDGASGQTQSSLKCSPFFKTENKTALVTHIWHAHLHSYDNWINPESFDVTKNVKRDFLRSLVVSDRFLSPSTPGEKSFRAYNTIIASQIPSGRSSTSIGHVWRCAADGIVVRGHFQEKWVLFAESPHYGQQWWWWKVACKWGKWSWRDACFVGHTVMWSWRIMMQEKRPCESQYEFSKRHCITFQHKGMWLYIFILEVQNQKQDVRPDLLVLKVKDCGENLKACQMIVFISFFYFHISITPGKQGCCGSEGGVSRPLIGKSVVWSLTPKICMPKCPWARHWTPNCSWWLFLQCVNVCIRVPDEQTDP